MIPPVLSQNADRDRRNAVAQEESGGKLPTDGGTDNGLSIPESFDQ
jgi:hypothetical protein